VFNLIKYIDPTDGHHSTRKKSYNHFNNCLVKLKKLHRIHLIYENDCGLPVKSTFPNRSWIWGAIPNL